MEIRKALIKDAKTVNNLLTLLIRDEKQYDPSINTDFAVTNMYENYIDKPGYLVIVAEENQKIMGYLYGYLKDNDGTYNGNIAKLDALFVLEEYRHQGIADALITYFKDWALKNHVKKIEVGVCSKNIKAKCLYEKHHFITTKEFMETTIS